MRIRYTWRSEEWKEALLLASDVPRGGAKPLLAYAMFGIMGLGAAGEMAHAVRSSAQIDFAGSLAPPLLMGAAMTALVFVCTRVANRKRRLRDTCAMPAEEQELWLGEEGWASCVAGAQASAPMRAWEEFTERRTGRRALILVGPESRFAAVPLRALSTAQGGHLHRLVTRKLRSSPNPSNRLNLVG